MVKAVARRRTQQGEQTHKAILDTAVDIASVEGLEGLSIGRLANEMNMSKSGLFAHFGSKEGLQLATIDAARAVFIEHIFKPALAEPRGLPRLWKFCDAWLTYLEKEIFRGGCFFLAASAEFDGRPGPVRDKIAENMKDWVDALEYAVRQAQEGGQIEGTVDAAQLAFELHALSIAANWSFQLYGDAQACNRARWGILAKLNSVVTANAPSLPVLESPAP
jgi:AcrR family transcriptional regulator